MDVVSLFDDGLFLENFVVVASIAFSLTQRFVMLRNKICVEFHCIFVPMRYKGFLEYKIIVRVSNATLSTK